MRIRTFTAPILLVLAALGVTPGTADAQILTRIKKAAKEAVAGEAAGQVDRLIRNAIRCAVDDPGCRERAKKEGKDVIFVDDSGEIITDADGAPITDRDAAAAAAPPPPQPGEGAWANYDFVPGDEILVFDDYSRDNVGDFPRNFDLIQGNWELIEWQGDRYLRATANGIIAIPLPKTLPERFTIEFPVSLKHGNAFVRVMPGRAYYGPARQYRGSAPSVELARAGLRSVGGEGPNALAEYSARTMRETISHVRIMADGEYMKMYLDERRVANVPNAVFPRGDTLFLAVGSAREDSPSMIGAIRIAGGGRDLYDRLARDGRVATQGILFATNSDRIRPESTPTLEEIGTMLTEHGDLELRIEGHTDDAGDDAYNQTLSEQRAAAVKRHLVERYGIDASRLQTAGLGETKPVASNDTPQGKQQNRRVELVKM